MVFVPYWFIDDRHTPRQRAVHTRASAENRPSMCRQTKKSRPYLQTDIRRPRRTRSSERDDPTHAQTIPVRSCRHYHVGTTLGTLHDDTLFARRPFARPQPPLSRTSGRLAV